MADFKTMVFSACRGDGAACIQYSWVPTGERHEIELNNKPVDSSQDDVNGQRISHVQVYRLRNVNMGLTKDWIFPAFGTELPEEVVGAYVHATNKQAFGYVVYKDGRASQVSYVDLEPVSPEYRCGPEKRG
jgi:hypothetical protein